MSGYRRGIERAQRNKSVVKRFACYNTHREKKKRKGVGKL